MFDKFVVWKKKKNSKYFNYLKLLKKKIKIVNQLLPNCLKSLLKHQGYVRNLKILIQMKVTFQRVRIRLRAN